MMVISRPPESALESREMLKQAIAFIGAHHLSANPVNYTVCYEYLLGTHPALKKEIDKAIQGKVELSDPMMAHWFKIYLSEYDLTHLQQSKSDLIDIISSLANSTQLTEENVTQFGHTLKRSEKELAEPNSSLETIVSHLLASTKSIQASMGLMRQQIQDSRHEISALQERLEKISEEAMTDSLTGLVNRKGLTKAIEAAISSIGELTSSPCILMIDIDHFKNINDTHGHLLGDNVIKVVSDTLNNQIKGKDTAARYGGEEFCVLLPETELQGAIKLAESIRHIVENTKIKRAKSQEEICRITVSIGVTRYRLKEPISDFFERADKALYRSKNDGRNRVTHIE
jgi:diguanylate cyclase